MDRSTIEFAPPRATRAAARVRIDAPLRDAGIAIVALLAIVLAAGLGARLAFGDASPHGGLDPPGLVDHLGPLGDVLAAPFARWDSVWYLAIAGGGYAPGPSTAFFPLYPLLLSAFGAAPLLAGVAISLGSLLVALRLLWRLTELEVGAIQPEAPRLAVLAAALYPMAFFFSAVYSESLFLALSLGAFLAARRERWALAGGLGALAAATRASGVLVALGLVLVWAGGRRRRADLLWLALVPCGLAAYIGWLALAGIDPLAPFHAQAAWFRHFAGPFGAVPDGLSAAIAGVRQLFAGATPIYFPAAGGDPLIASWHNLMLFGFLLAALPALFGVMRRLPTAYGAYTLASLALPLSYPVAPQPLSSLPRYIAVIFPLHMAAGVWLARHPRLRYPLLGASALALACFAALFATWHWVA